MDSHEAQIAKIVGRNVAERKPGERGTASMLQEIGSETTLTVGLESGTGTWLAHIEEDENLIVVVPHSAVVERGSDTSEGGPRAVVVRY